MANLDDFRGPGEPDSGTAFEVGFAAALAKPVWGYRSNAVTLAKRVEATSVSSAGGVCRAGYLIEDFGLTVNLMLAWLRADRRRRTGRLSRRDQGCIGWRRPPLGGSGLAKR